MVSAIDELFERHQKQQDELLSQHQEEIASLKKQITTLEREYEEKIHFVKDDSRKVQRDFKQQIITLEHTIENLKTKLCERKELYDILKEKYDRAEREHHTLVEENADILKRLKDEMNNLSGFMSVSSNLQSSPGPSRGVSSEKLTEVSRSSLRDSPHRFNVSKSSYPAQLNLSDLDIDLLKSSLKDLILKFNSVEKERDEQKDVVAKLQRETDELKGEHTQCISKIYQLKRDLEVPEEIHIRHCKLLEFHNDNNATVATKNICDVYPSALDVHKCQRKFSKFRSGNFDLSNSHRSGRPTTFDNDVIKDASGSKSVSDN
ncbi:UNVERIFIED_CONTAM: hypothetical protein NCL1_27198 [Trichonephila clavipes]